MTVDERYMAQALTLARLGRGSTSPNPMVGAMVVKNGSIIGSGCHLRPGGPHAETIALAAAGSEARGATLYVTLEPCCHTGRTPPCTDGIRAAGVRRVVVAMRDPNPQVNGRGMSLLVAAGVEVELGVLEEEAKQLNEVFIKYVTSQRPFVSLKAAMTLDGKIATHTGASRWISSQASREYGHRLRHVHDVIMVGVGTVLADDPSLTTRIPEGGKHPRRVIIDSRARTPLTSQVVREQPENTWVFTTPTAPTERIEELRQRGVEVVTCPGTDQGRVALAEVMQELGRRKVACVLVEGGSTLNYSLLESALVDKVYCFIAPLLLGGASAPTPVGGQGRASVDQAWRLVRMETSPSGEDCLLTAYIDYGNQVEEG